MQLTVHHTTEYRFTDAVRHSVHYLRLSPRTQAGQFVKTWRIKSTGSLAPWTDGYGNEMRTLFIETDHNRLRVEASGVVLTEDAAGVFRGDGETLPPPYWLRQTPLTAPGPDLRLFVEDLPAAARGDDRLEALHELSRRLSRHLAFDHDRTTIDTTASGAFAAGRGVCQDFAHIMLSCCRHLGVPARYVSGFLFTGNDAQINATHAWIEAHVPGLGWVGFDAANDICPTEHYIRLAIGLDYRECSPINGVRFGAGEAMLEVSVTVRDDQ